MGRGMMIFLSSVMVAVLFAAFHGMVGAQEDIIILEHKDAINKLQRPPVKFTHAKHAELYPDCIQCHHTYEYKGGQKVNDWSGEGQPCSECHKVVEDGKKIPLMKAFHENCRGCHRQLVKEGKKTGPVACGECHIRQKPAKD